MSTTQIIIEQYKKLPVLVEPGTCSGKVYIVTGANSGLGLETARHLVRGSAEKVIMACRNVAAGKQARADIERTTGRVGVADVWPLDLASTASVQAFAKRAYKELERVDGLIENAGVFLDKFETVEGFETTIAVNVVNTIFLGVLMMPKLIESAKRFGNLPHLVFVVSALGVQMEKELAKSKSGSKIFDGLNNPKLASMDDRYSLSKLVQMYAVRELASVFPAEQTGVVINMVAPGFCSTGLARDARFLTRVYMAVTRVMFARTAEQGSRTILHGLVSGQQTHGKHLSGCKVKEHWIPDWMMNAEGQRTQAQIWKELVAHMDGVNPGCISRISQPA